MIAPTHDQVDDLLQLVLEECMINQVLHEEVLVQHLARQLRLRDQRAIAPLTARSFDHDKVHETLGNSRDCKRTVAWALNSSRMLSAKADDC